MPKINVINYYIKLKTKTFAFVLLMFSESFLTNNLLVFKDLNIFQIDRDKTNLQLSY